MKVWVLSLEENNELGNLITGVWGVYSSLSNAINAYKNKCVKYDEQEQGWTCLNEGLFIFTTNHSKWRIESILIDD